MDATHWDWRTMPETCVCYTFSTSVEERKLVRRGMKKLDTSAFVTTVVNWNVTAAQRFVTRNAAAGYASIYVGKHTENAWPTTISFQISIVFHSDKRKNLIVINRKILRWNGSITGRRQTGTRRGPELWLTRTIENCLLPILDRLTESKGKRTRTPEKYEKFENETTFFPTCCGIPFYISKNLFIGRELSRVREEKKIKRLDDKVEPKSNGGSSFIKSWWIAAIMKRMALLRQTCQENQSLPSVVTSPILFIQAIQ